MRKDTTIVLLTTLMFFFSSLICLAQPPRKSVSSKKSLPWLYDLSKAKLAARAKHKLIVVDVFTDNCGWCKRLDHETFENPGVVDELGQRVIWLKLNARISIDELKPYKIDGFPTILILNDSGKLVSSFSGYLPPEQFAEKIAMLLP